MNVSNLSTACVTDTPEPRLNEQWNFVEILRLARKHDTFRLYVLLFHRAIAYSHRNDFVGKLRKIERVFSEFLKLCHKSLY